APPSSVISRPRSGASWTRSCHSASGTSPPRATARGPSSLRRSSRKQASTATCGGSPPPSSSDPRHGPPTRSSPANARTRRSCRTGARGSGTASRRCAVSLRSMRLLVTGGAGFIGSNFVHYWLGTHSEGDLVVYDLLTYAGNRDSLASVEDRITFVQ